VDEIKRNKPAWPYRQLADLLRPIVTAMPADELLPPVRRLCEEYGVSEKTARKALGVLADEGLVYFIASRGSFRK
jgi:DNA-binding GntR family transcriptional regulator